VAQVSLLRPGVLQDGLGLIPAEDEQRMLTRSVAGRSSLTKPGDRRDVTVSFRTQGTAWSCFGETQGPDGTIPLLNLNGLG
jgi:hypothetical protein